MFGGRRTPTAPSNESVALVPVFTPDPHGAAMFAGIIRGNSMAGARPVIDARGDAWHGAVPSPQRTDMTGAGYLGAGRPVVPYGTRLDQERSLVSDPIRAAFEQRTSGGELR